MDYEGTDYLQMISNQGVDMSVEIYEVMSFAERCHYGQKYGKHEYTYHLAEVLKNAEKIANDIVECSACSEVTWFYDCVHVTALLHDVLEDCTFVYAEDIESFLIGLHKNSKLMSVRREPFLGNFNNVGMVMRALDSLTHKNDDTYEEYLQKISEAGNTFAVIVKKADILANLTQSVIDGDSKRVHKYVKRLELFNRICHPSFDPEDGGDA